VARAIRLGSATRRPVGPRSCSASNSAPLRPLDFYSRSPTCRSHDLLLVGRIPGPFERLDGSSCLSCDAVDSTGSDLSSELYSDSVGFPEASATRQALHPCVPLDPSDSRVHGFPRLTNSVMPSWTEVMGSYGLLRPTTRIVALTATTGISDPWPSVCVQSALLTSTCSLAHSDPRAFWAYLPALMRPRLSRLTDVLRVLLSALGSVSLTPCFGGPSGWLVMATSCPSPEATPSSSRRCQVAHFVSGGRRASLPCASRWWPRPSRSGSLGGGSPLCLNRPRARSPPYHGVSGRSSVLPHPRSHWLSAPPSPPVTSSHTARVGLGSPRLALPPFPSALYPSRASGPHTIPSRRGRPLPRIPPPR